MDPSKNRIKICAHLGRSVMETLAMIRQALGAENTSRARMFEWHARYVKSKVKSVLIIVFDIKGIDRS
jgi:hypothetical protein